MDTDANKYSMKYFLEICLYSVFIGTKATEMKIIKSAFIHL